MKEVSQHDVLMEFIQVPGGSSHTSVSEKQTLQFVVPMCLHQFTWFHFHTSQISIHFSLQQTLQGGFEEAASRQDSGRGLVNQCQFATVLFSQ